MVLYCTFLSSSQPPTWHLSQLVDIVTYSQTWKFGISVNLLAKWKIWHMGRNRYTCAQVAQLAVSSHMLPHDQWVAQVVVWAEVASLPVLAVCGSLMVVHLVLCATSISVDPLLPVRERSHPSVWMSWILAWCLSTATFTFQYTEISTPFTLSSHTMAQHCMMNYCISWIVVQTDPSLAWLAKLNTMYMSDCSSCIWPPCIAIVVDMLKTYKKLVHASKIEIQWLPFPSILV